MTTKRVIIGGVIMVTVGLALWMGLYPVDWENWLGFSQYDYFHAGTNYAFASGPGPMLLTAAGMSTIIGGLWHAHNCHADGCWNLGKHRVKGSPWCNAHLELANQEDSIEDLLRKLITEVQDVRAEMIALKR